MPLQVPVNAVLDLPAGDSEARSALITVVTVAHPAPLSFSGTHGQDDLFPSKTALWERLVFMWSAVTAIWYSRGPLR
jgi:hypothetical protein